MNGDRIKIACLQMPIVWGKEEFNIQYVLNAFDGLQTENPDLICLPELFTTGFDYGYLKKRSPRITWDILDKLSAKAKERHVYILAGTLPETAGDRIYNTLFILDPHGERAGFYRKMHLIPLMDEDAYFCAGKAPLIFQTPWGKIGVAVCYDLRFSDLFRSLALNGAEIVFVAAQFPAARIDHWDILLKARAIENQVFMVGLNRVGRDPSNEYPGHSCIVDPMGHIRSWGGEAEGWMEGSIDLAEVEKVRRELPALFYKKD